MGMKKSHFLQKMFVCMMAFLVGALPVTSTYALTEQQLDRFAQNNILFYDPNGGCSGGGNGVVTILEGNNVAEKVWNWFASAGIASVSDNASVIAGIIGNLMTEAGGSTFDINPFIVSSLGYYGMYQAGGGRATKLQNAFTRADLSNLWRSQLSSVSEENINKAVDVTLTELTTGDDGSFRTFVSKLNEVDENKPEAYSDLFLVIVERAIGGDSEILDSGAKRLSDGGKYQGSASRRKNAVQAFNSFSGNTGSGTTSGIQSDVKSVICGGSGELVAGGMTLGQAVQFMQAYRNIQPRNYHEPGGDILNKWHINNVSSCASDLENCVAFVQYFICEYGNVCMGLPDGGEVVGHLLSSGRGFIDGGTTPRPYAIFSNSSHTGVVLGVDTASNKIIIGEAGCGKNITYSWTNAHEYPLSDWTSGKYRYAYTDNIIRL